MKKNEAKPPKIARLENEDPVPFDEIRSAPSFAKNSPNQDVPLLFHHHEVNSRILVLTHERMRNEVQEHIG